MSNLRDALETFVIGNLDGGGQGRGHRHFLKSHITQLKHYLKVTWQTDTRTISLNDIPEFMLLYTNKQINSYLASIWLKRIKIRAQLEGNVVRVGTMDSDPLNLPLGKAERHIESASISLLTGQGSFKQFLYTIG